MARGSDEAGTCRARIEFSALPVANRRHVEAGACHALAKPLTSAPLDFSTRNQKPSASSMSVLIVGSTALDSIKTPAAENPKLLGGSASHAAVAASFFSPVKIVGVVGEDFPKKYVGLYRKHRID